MAEKVTTQEVISRVCKIFDCKNEDLGSKVRKRNILYARHTAIFLIYEPMKVSESLAGELFNRDHSTVNFARKKIQRLLKSDKEFQSKIQTDEFISELLYKLN